MFHVEHFDVDAATIGVCSIFSRCFFAEDFLSFTSLSRLAVNFGAKNFFRGRLFRRNFPGKIFFAAIFRENLFMRFFTQGKFFGHCFFGKIFRSRFFRPENATIAFAIKSYFNKGKIMQGFSFYVKLEKF